MKKVLVAEDESSIREFVVINLKRNGYDVVEAADGAQAIEKYKACNGDIDVAILDIMMPYVDGLEVCKPFSPSELMARVDVLYRRVEMSAGFADSSHANVITSGEFELNMRNRTLTKNGIPIELTQVEFQIMEYFFTNQDAALSRTDILEKVWGSDYFGEEKIVDVNIRRLRMKVEDNPSAPKHLLTMWGVGYKWIA